MKYPLAALEAVAKVVEDPDTAAEVMQELDAAGFVIAKFPADREDHGPQRIGRIVSRIVFLDQRIEDMEVAPGRPRHKAINWDKGEASALRYLLDCLGIHLNSPDDYMHWINQMGSEKKLRGQQSIARFQNDNAQTLRQAAEGHQNAQAPSVRTVAGNDGARGPQGFYEALRRV